MASNLLARKSLEKRKKILQAFEEIQKAMTSANPLKGSFRSHADVAVALDDLQQAIVDSVNDILVLTAKEDRSWRGLKKNLIQRTKYPDIDLVLKLLSEKTQALKDALEDAHYQSIENIDNKTTYIAVGTGYVARGVRHLDEKVDLQRKEMHSVSIATQEQKALLKSQDEKMNRLMTLFETVANDKDVIADANSKQAAEAPPEDLGAWLLNKITDALVAQKRDTEIQKYFSRGESGNSRRRRGAVINNVQFCEAITDHPFYEDEEPDIEGFAAQPDSDWTTASRYQGDFDSKTQSQVQSILEQRRFLGWMKSKYPDLVLVLADLPASDMGNITAVSVFCATLITSLTSLRRGDLVLHFFCGLHVDSSDPSPGPRGLVRSLIMQLFTYLTRASGASLDFISDREYVRDIEDQHLGALCQTLRELLWQCEPGDADEFGTVHT
ncbi:hypothetical protein SLS63_012133 [Diaporthe eres]|uniref:Uncharacterized protein n=1 Tax=Diaporthe eres TaxID=83184 RepID=A0ABR1NS21_DIAER